jgi:hypothetical protein
LLAERGQHRVPSIPDLLVAAKAELTGRTELYLDKDFELIARLSGRVPNQSPEHQVLRRAIPRACLLRQPRESLR